VTPDPPEAVEGSTQDSTSAFVRNTTVMSVGTALSRITGFLRLAAMTYAIGVTETRLPYAYNVANITPNIIYELALGLARKSLDSASSRYVSKRSASVLFSSTIIER
jgi:hypothetical protein